MASDGTIKIDTELDSSKAQSAMSKFSSTAKSAMKGVKIAVGTASAAITAMAGYSVKVGSDFEAGMSKVQAISGATGEELDALTEKAKEMGAKTKFSATQSAEAFEYMAMAGWKTEDMLGGIEGVMNLAAASGESLATTSDIVTDAMTAFGMKASESAHFADVLAKASSNSNTNVGMMGETFKYVAPVAGALGFNIEDCAVAIGLMANSGIKASQAGTSLRQLFTNLAKPTKQMKGVMDELKLSLTDAQGHTKKLDEVMQDLRKGFAGLSEAQKAQYAATLAGQEGMSGLLAIVNASESDFASLSSQINNADGAAESMAETMNDNLKGSITIAGSALEGFGIKIYEKMQAPLKEAVDNGTKYINRLSSAFGSGGVSGAVQEAGKIFDDLTDELASTSDAAYGVITPMKQITTSAANLGKNVLPVVANGLKFTAENFGKIAPVAASAAAGMKAYVAVTKSANVATTANTVATKLLGVFTKSSSGGWATAKKALERYAEQMEAAKYTGRSYNVELTAGQAVLGLFNRTVDANTAKTTVATAATGLFAKAQAGLSAAIAANPIGAAILGTAALGTALTALIKVTDEQVQKNYRLSESDQKIISAMNDTTRALNEQRSSREQSVQSIDMEYDGYESLLAELQSITDKNGKVKSGYEQRAKVITGQLAEALGIEITLQDGAIKGYEKTVGAIKEVIVQKKAEALCSALQEDMANAYKNSQSAMSKYNSAVATASEKEAKLAEIKKKYQDAEDNWNQTGSPKAYDSMQKLSKAVETAQKAYDKASGAADKAKTELNAISTEVNNYDALVQAMADGSSQKIEAAMNNLLTGYQSYTKDMLSGSETAQKEMLQQSTDSINALQMVIDSGGSVYQAFGEKAAAAAAGAIKNFDNLPGGIASAIEKIGPESSAALISALAQANLDGKLSEEGRTSAEAFLTAMNSENIDGETKEIFAQTVYGALEGLEGFDQLADPAKEGADTFLESLRSALEVHSPSRATEEIFSQVWPGAVQGLENDQGDLEAKGQSVIQNFLASLSAQGITGKTQKIGAKLMSFFGIGVSSGTKKSKAAGKANADAANSGAGTSKVGETGKAFGKSYADAIARTLGLSQAAGKTIAKGANGARGVASYTGRGAGRDFGMGYANGIASALSHVIAKAKNLAKAALNAVKKEQVSNSPAKKTIKLGHDYGDGYAIGIEDRAKQAGKASEKLTRAALSSVETDSLMEKIRNLDVPDVMSRFCTAADERQEQTAQRVTAAVAAQENMNWARREQSQVVKLSKDDIKSLAKEFSKVVSKDISSEMVGIEFKVDRRQMGRLIREEQR